MRNKDVWGREWSTEEKKRKSDSQQILKRQKECSVLNDWINKGRKAG